MSLGREICLVTGFPDFHARRLCFQLLEAEPELQLIVLRRAADAERSAQALNPLPLAQRERITELEGDPTALDFGLSGVEYRTLADSVQRVYHFASVLEAKRSAGAALHNIAAAREVLEFSNAARALRGLVLLSSVNVCGTRTGLIREDELNQGQTFRNRLEESLATVELMCSRRTALPQIVLRPAQIVGDSQTGEIDSPGFPYPWLAFVERGPEELVVPVPYRADAPVQIVPIDFVVRAAHFLSTRPEAYGQRYHLIDPQPLTLKQFLQLAASASGKRLVESFNPGAFTRGLRAKPGLRMLTQGARGLLERFAGTTQFDSSNADRALAGSGIACPSLASSLPALLSRARSGAAAHEVESIESTELDADG